VTWYSVRHVIRNSRAFEERITLWDASSFEEAVEVAKGEAQAYASIDPSWELLNFFQVFSLGDRPGSGDEVFSLIRESDLDAEGYVTEFFESGKELQTDL